MRSIKRIQSNVYIDYLDNKLLQCAGQIRIKAAIQAYEDTSINGLFTEGRTVRVWPFQDTYPYSVNRGFGSTTVVTEDS